MINVIVVIGLRVVLAFNIIPIPSFNDKNLKVMAQKFKSFANGSPLVFFDDYSEPAAYMFYEKDTCYTINTIHYKRTQFNFLEGYESQLQNKDVLLVTKNTLNAHSSELTIPKGHRYYFTPISNFKSFYSKIYIKALNLTGAFTAASDYSIKYQIQHSLSESDIKLLQHAQYKLGLALVNETTKQIHRFTTELNDFDKDTLTFNLKLPEEKGSYKCSFFIDYYNHLYLKGFNSDIYYIKIK